MATMEAEGKTEPSSLAIEEGRKEGDRNLDFVLPSAHAIGHDSWQQVGLMLVTSFNCGYILSFSNLILVPLGWTWGIICLLVVGFYIAYGNWLLAAFHFVDGQRFIRYRDIMGSLYEKCIISLGLSSFSPFFLEIWEINSVLTEDPLRLQYYIIITGVAYFLFAFLIPTMSDMKFWLGPSTIITVAYVVILLVLTGRDVGKRTNRERDYEIHGSMVGKMFNGFGAISAIVVCNTTGLLLEIQSTLRKPVVTNMRKALSLQYTVGLIFYYGVSVLGYWAYGSTVSEYLPEELNTAKWVKVLINSAVFLQAIVSQHMFVAPIHEALDTNFLKLDESMNSKENCKRRFFLRAFIFTINSFVTAAFPFMGDFVNLFGSFSLIPLTFTFPSMIFIKVKGKTARTEQKLWHWFNVVFSSLLTVMTTISAVRLIVHNVWKYNFFADT
ncbi:hypothetical protein FEM48_Zijuj05G0061000 [Ziziphus jujuba var. spinosa]|uniref:Amino acid transporter transmembrane domain-containing protein n=1 Tax=Ziziphus jujuba var. spinosa TaxID=714518 RepID=A0A978VD89_ZIZJJ|nr:hypothetical protein FEM48_Zijuj05G0061000 [Ziziphus jujuba var. spinosa]